MNASRYAAAIAVCCASAFASNAASITNGSFETPVLSPGAVPGYPIGSTAITGWTVVANDGTTTNNGHDVALASNANPYGLNTPFGAQFMDITGFADTVPYSGVSQTIATVANQAYLLTLWLGASTTDARYVGPVSVKLSAGSATATIFNDGTTIQTAGNTSWSQQTFAFTASGTSTVLNIVGNSAAGGQFLGLDNISIADASAGAVPEPVSWSMAVCGFGFVGGAMRRRRRTNVTFA